MYTIDYRYKSDLPLIDSSRYLQNYQTHSHNSWHEYTFHDEIPITNGFYDHASLMG